MTEKDIQKTMTKLDLTREEAIAMLQEDEMIDKMSVKEAQSDLSAEQKKAIKSAAAVGAKKRTAVKRERKVDKVKKEIINCVRVLLEGMGAIAEPLKNETDLHFTFKGDSYSVKLIKHRPPKGEK
jgi:hypothetical protein